MIFIFPHGQKSGLQLHLKKPHIFVNGQQSNQEYLVPLWDLTFSKITAESKHHFSADIFLSGVEWWQAFVSIWKKCVKSKDKNYSFLGILGDKAKPQRHQTSWRQVQNQARRKPPVLACSLTGILIKSCRWLPVWISRLGTYFQGTINGDSRDDDNAIQSLEC